MASSPNPPISVEHRLVTTAFTLDGYRIVRTLGVVRDFVVRSRSIFRTVGASLQPAQQAV